MLIGFGCSVPAIMATRTLASDRDRKMTILLTPFMSCSAKIPIYAVFCAAFFARYQALVMIGLYVAGIIIGILVALLLKGTAFRGEPVPFVMELPNYRMPSPKNVLLLLWEKAKDFLERAFTIILLASVVIWFLQTFDTRLNVVSDSATSLLAMIGRGIAPIFRPMGFADWRVATSLISGFVAKEAVVSTLSVLMGTGVAQLHLALPSLFTTLSAVSFLLFTLLYTPCVAAVATIRKELKSGWATPRADLPAAGLCGLARGNVAHLRLCRQRSGGQHARRSHGYGYCNTASGAAESLHHAFRREFPALYAAVYALRCGDCDRAKGAKERHCDARRCAHAVRDCLGGRVCGLPDRRIVLI